eukprot:533972-Karenia_brevis.AAC.1
MLEVLGTPISWRKVAGGFAYEWIGYWQDLQHCRVGISEQRTAWLRTWTQGLATNKAVLVR